MCICWLINISLGSVHIPNKEILKSLFGHETAKESWNYIILNYRLPKSFTAILVGSGLYKWLINANFV